MLGRNVRREIAGRPLAGVVDAQAGVDVVVALRIGVAPAVVRSFTLRLHGVYIVRRSARICGRARRAVTAGRPKSKDPYAIYDREPRVEGRGCLEGR